MKNWFSKNSKDIICLIVLTVIVCMYFGRLFYPKLSVYNTPDLGLSDVLNVNYSLKEFLSQNLKNYQLPLWSKQLQNGFPALAESQIGALNLLNLILFYFFKTPIAFNLAYIISLLTASFSMFIYLRYLKLKSLSALFGSLSFTFSGVIVFQISHTNLLQGISMLPLFFLLTEIFLQRPTIFKASLIAFFLSQQLFFGFPQTTFITLVGITILVGYHIFKTNVGKNYIDRFKNLLLGKTFLLYFFSIVLFLIFSAPQIIPTLEYTVNSNRRSGTNIQEVLNTSFAPMMFGTLISPYIFGSPKEGNFSVNYYDRGIFYWESIIYYGILPLIFTVIVLFFVKKNLRKRFFIVLGIISAILMLGKYSPFYILFSFFPFNNFRAQSRFDLLFVFSLVILSTYGFEFFSEFLKKKFLKLGNLILILILLITGLDLFFTTYNYQPIEPVDKLSASPETAKYLKNIGENARVFSFGGDIVFAKKFYNNGFKNLDIYRYFRNDLQADLNLVYKITTSRGFIGSNYFLLRKNLIEKSVLSKIINTANSKAIDIPFSSINLLRVYGVDYVLAPYKLSSDNLSLVFKTSKFIDLNPYYLYKLKTTTPRIYFPKNIVHAKTFESSIEILTNKNFLPNYSVLLDPMPSPFKLNANSLPEYKILNDRDQLLEIKIKSKNQELMVLNDTFYPGWKAFIDNKETEIFSANIINRAIIIPRGNHSIIFKFEPVSFKIGLIIASVGYLLIVFLMVFQLISSSRDRGFDKN